MLEIDDILRDPNGVIERLLELKVDDAQNLINVIVTTNNDRNHVINEIASSQNLLTKLTMQVDYLKTQGKDAGLWESDLKMMKETREDLLKTKDDLENLLQSTLEKVNDYLK